jgi:ribosomal protein S1
MDNGSTLEQKRRRFVRLELTEDVRAIDEHGQEIGRVEKVGAGGMQIRMSELSRERGFLPGSQMRIKVVEPNDLQQHFDVEVRVCDGDLLGVQFLN